ncbi:MAG: monogalactosyldiacylglycerol synthase [Mycobacterium sp.]|nr:monogalactosyldiacylglycerol synthase [Mycobacterium sp.]
MPHDGPGTRTSPGESGDLEPGTRDGRARVLVVTASMGAGHVRAAEELCRRLEAAGHDAALVDFLGLPGDAHGDRLRGTYAVLLRRFPWVYEASMRVWARFPGAFRRLTLLGSGGYQRGLARAVAGYRPDVVVSTYNLASQVLGRLTERGRLDVPVVTYVTDPGAHAYWVHPAVARHLAVSAGTAAALRALGAAGVAAVDPLVGEEFRDLPATDADRAAARRRADLPEGRLVALVSGGSWAVGDVLATVRALTADPRILPVVLCGRDERLRQQVAAEGGARALGWTDAVAGLMAAADVLVDNAGGLTCLEALSVCLPVVLFGVLPGHGRLNAAALHAQRRATWARTPAELRAAVHRLAQEPRRPPPPAGGDPVRAVLQAAVRG